MKSIVENKSIEFGSYELKGYVAKKIRWQIAQEHDGRYKLICPNFFHSLKDITFQDMIFNEEELKYIDKSPSITEHELAIVLYLKPEFITCGWQKTEEGKSIDIGEFAICAPIAKATLLKDFAWNEEIIIDNILEYYDSKKEPRLHIAPLTSLSFTTAIYNSKLLELHKNRSEFKLIIDLKIKDMDGNNHSAQFIMYNACINDMTVFPHSIHTTNNIKIISEKWDLVILDEQIRNKEK